MVQYGTLNYAAKDLGLWVTHIGSVCRGNGQTSGGFVWRYTNGV